MSATDGTRRGPTSLDAPAGDGRLRIAPLGDSSGPNSGGRNVNNFQHPSGVDRPTRAGSDHLTKPAPLRLSGSPSLDGLSALQVNVARLVAVGYADKVIAARVGRSEDTIAYHVKRIAILLGLDRMRNVRVQITQRVCSAVYYQLGLRKRVMRAAGT